jgi:hypothetical protein
LPNCSWRIFERCSPRRLMLSSSIPSCSDARHTRASAPSRRGHRPQRILGAPRGEESISAPEDVDLIV